MVLRASRAVDLWRPEERLPREPHPVRAARARLKRALQRSRDRFRAPARDKRWL
jgi:hypothetical protein